MCIRTVINEMKDLDGLPKLYLRGQIAPKESLFSMFGDPDEETVSATDVRNFLDANKDAPELVIEFSSDGGYKTEGIEMYQLLKNAPQKIYGVIYKANSIATVVVLGCAERYVSEDSQFYIHFSRIDPMNLGMDPLTSEDFQRLAEETSRTDKQILDIYCRELGEEKRGELLASMAEEKDLGAKGAVKLGFASGYYKKKKKDKAEAMKACLIEDSIALIIQNNMDNKVADKVTAMEKLIASTRKAFVKMLNGKVKNELTLVTDKGSIYVVPVNPDEPDNLVGASVYTVDADGIQTEDPAPDGVYTLTDTGKTVTVAGGKITEEGDLVDAKKLAEDLAAEKAKGETLAAEIAALKTQIEAKEQEIVQARQAAQTEMQAKLDIVQNEFNSLAKQVRGDKKEKGEDEGTPNEPDLTQMTTAQRAAYLAKERRAELRANRK